MEALARLLHYHGQAGIQIRIFRFQEGDSSK
jgi:hypothetical protein